MPIPTTSARRSSICAGAQWQVPAITPAEHFQPALHEALAARAIAAGGAEHIISGDDVDKLIADVMGEDDRAVAAARRRCRELRRDLDRAELTTAAAFAAAEIRSADHITAQLDELDTELRVLQAASRYQPQRPLPMPPSAVADLPPAAATALTSTAALPFAVTVLDAAPSDERTAALHALHDAASAANRNLLWCSPTQEQADDGPRRRASRPPPLPSPKPTPRSPAATPRCRQEH